MFSVRRRPVWEALTKLEFALAVGAEATWRCGAAVVVTAPSLSILDGVVGAGN
jgi:hypothetical protein